MGLVETEQRSRELVELKPNETKDITFAFEHKASSAKATIEVIVLGYLLAGVGQAGTAGLEYGSELLFTWPPGSTGNNPRRPEAIYREVGGPGVTGTGAFAPPPTVLLPTAADDTTLKLKHKHLDGGALVTKVTVELEVIEVYFAEETKRPEEGEGGSSFNGGGSIAGGTTSTGLIRMHPEHARGG